MRPEKKIRIAVLGVGGTGGYLGTRLWNHYHKEEGVEIIFIQRGAHLKEIQRNGLKYITRDHAYFVFPHLATDDPEEAGIFDLVLFCVKSYDLEPSALSLKKNLGSDSIAISILNGVDSGQRLRKVLTVPQVLTGCIYISARIERPGWVRQVGGAGNFFFGPEDGEIEKYFPMESFLRNANIKAVLDRDIRYRIWEKYIFVCPLASLTALEDRPIGIIMKEEKTRKLLFRLIDEIRTVARKEGVDIPERVKQSVLKRVEMIPPETITSMQLDFRSGKKTEIDIFTGYVVRKGRECGIPVPQHDAVYSALLEKLESGNSAS